MSAKQVSSGYVLWKTGPEPVRHSHSGERPAFDCRPCSGMVKSHTGGVLSGWEYAVVGSMGENRLPQPVPIPKKFSGIVRKNQAAQAMPVPKRFPGIVWKSSDCPDRPVPKKSPGQGRPAALVPKLPSGGSSPQTPVQKNTRKVIGPSGCSVM